MLQNYLSGQAKRFFAGIEGQLTFTDIIQKKPGVLPFLKLGNKYASDTLAYGGLGHTPEGYIRMSDTKQLMLFDYLTLTSETAEFVQRRTLEIRAFQKRTAESIIQIGLRLEEVKEAVGHGQFLNWLEIEFGWSDQTARRYIHVAIKFNNLLNLDHYATSAMYLLAAPSTPDAVLDRAQEMTVEGQYISHAKAQELLAQYWEPKPAPEPESESVPEEEQPEDEPIKEPEPEPKAEPEYYACPECGEVLSSEMWHCLSCHCHWPPDVPKCLSCGMPHITGKLIAAAKMLKEKAPDLFNKVRSGEYTITQAKREAVKRERAETPPIPSDKYRVLYADPPWKYGNAGIIGKSDNYGHAERHYPTMSIKELCALPIKELTEDNAILFLWVTSPLLAECFPVITAWGFKYKTSFIWDKIKHNFGHYNSVRHELLLICTRGSCTPDVSKLFDSVQSIERSEHSEKPEEFREIIDTLYIYGKRIELFARRQVEGTKWDTWGNEPTTG